MNFKEVYYNLVAHKKQIKLLNPMLLKYEKSYYNSFLEKVNLLLEYGANPNIKNKSGHNILFYAYLIGDKNLIKKINIYNIDKKKISYSHLNQVIQEKIIVYLNRYDLHIETNLELLGDDINSLFSYFLKTKYWSPWNFIIDLGNYNEAKEILLKFIKVRKYPHINLFEYCNCDNISNETYNCSICKKSRKSINDILITSKYNDWEIYQLKKLIVSIGNNFNINWNSNYTIKYYDEKIKPYSPIKIFCEDDINLVYYVLNCWYYSNKSKKINLSNIPIEILGIVIKFLI